jgi:hypothetical protein
MIYPRCGALIEALPCSECGFPENMKRIAGGALMRLLEQACSREQKNEQGSDR